MSETEPLSLQILVVAARSGSLDALKLQLERRYPPDYEVVVAPSPGEAQKVVDGLDNVALVLIDMALDGAEPLLAYVREKNPATKRAVVGVWGDAQVGQRLQAAVRDGLAEDYVLPPMVVPDEKFHRSIGGLLEEWSRAHLPRFEMIKVIGDPSTARAHRTRDLLRRYGIPFGFYDVDSSEGGAILQELGILSDRAPVWVLFDGRVLLDPSDQQAADALTAGAEPEESRFDVVIIGGGPAGLAAAVYSASEGLTALVVESEAIGGQAGTTSMVRNYLGFQRGISGQELTERAFQQAWSFGAAFRFLRSAKALCRKDRDFVIELSDDTQFRARAVILAHGVSYRRLGVPDLEDLVGAGVFYGAAVTEAEAMTGKRVFIVGGGNSAGQAAVHLAKFARRVTLLIRGESLATTMSDYLIKEIDANDHIEVRTGVEVTGGAGGDRLTNITMRAKGSGRLHDQPADGLFVMIGAIPDNSWLPEEIARDRWGYLLTGADLANSDNWALERSPYAFETSLPGVFAVGDVRHASVKRVASAVGEGSVAVQSVHHYLQEAG